MKNNALPIILFVAVLVAAAIYYQQHTHTATIGLPGGKGISITTHD